MLHWIAAALIGIVALIGLLLALYGPDTSVSIITGPLPTAVLAVGAAGLVIGVAGRPRRWWGTCGLGIAGASAALVAATHWWLHASGLVTQHYPPTFAVWAWLGGVAVGIGVTGWWDGPAVVRVVRFVTVPVVVFGSFLLIDAHYGYWPTMGALLDRPVPGQVSGDHLAAVLAGRVSGPDGTYGPVSIPGPRGFDPGVSWVWLPPAYHRLPSADLPVLVMLPGWPGRANNWERAGEAVPLAEAWARNHGGVAPVMVFVSGNGVADRDTECVNGTQGRAETFLARDVPDFITERLGISRNPARWGAVGFSEGGTCALGLATEQPDIFGRVVDISGELLPSFGPNATTTLRGLYAGHLAEMLRHEPLWLFSHRFYPHTDAWFAAGAQDRFHERIARRLTDAASHAGVDAQDVSGGPGDHSWSYARSVLELVYPALVDSMPAPVSHLQLGPDRNRIFVADRRPDAKRDHHRTN
jgi:S-formylglutathione hydrolase FrmB